MEAWPRCLERLEAEYPAEDVHTWLKPLQARLRDDALVLYAPNAFVMDEVRSRYLERIPVVALDGEELFDYEVDRGALLRRILYREGG